MEDEVLALAKSLGQIGEKEAQVLGTLCGEACRTLDRRLLPGVTAESCADAYKLAAAWLALAALEESRGGVRYEVMAVHGIPLGDGVSHQWAALERRMEDAI